MFYFRGVASLMRLRLSNVPHRSSNVSGFTLIELMISLFVFAIGMLAVTAMCLMSIQGNSLVNRMTQANFLAQGRMEELLSERVMTVLDTQDDPSGVSIDGVGDAGVNYLRTVDISFDTTDTRWITVKVSWSDTKGGHHVELKSLARSR